MRRMVTEDGHEFRFQVNHLSHFLLTRMFLPRLRENAPSRIVNVSSGAQQPIDFDDVMIENNFSGGRAYAQSKLAQIMFTIDLAEEQAGTDVVVNALHPATYMDTGMVRRAGRTPRATVGEGGRRGDAADHLTRYRQWRLLQPIAARACECPSVRRGGSRQASQAE